MKIGNKSKFISVLIGAAMCPMMLPTAAFAAGVGAPSGVSSSPTELIQSSESEGADTGASSGDTLAAQSESTGEAANATTGKAANEVAAPAAETGGEGTTAAVAEVGGKNYSSLQEAINKAQGGETVTLLTDATEDVTIAGKNITLDLGGKTLTNTNTGKATLTIAKGATATVKNGSIVGGTGFYTIQNNGTATLEDVTATAGNTGSSMLDNWGTLTIESGSYSGGLNVVKSEEGSTLSITGGTFTLDYAPSSGYTAVILVYGDTTISGGEFVQTATPKWGNPQVVMTGVVEGYTAITRVTGGHFTNKKSGSNIFHGLGKATSDNFEVSGGTFNKSISEGYCADGFIPTKNADGTYGVKEGHYVAQIGSKKYETLADAIRLAAKGKTITLLTDVEQNTQLTINKNITLDLNGKTIKNTVDIWGDNANAILSIKNGAKVTITGDGTIDAKENDCYTINVVKGDLTIENGTFYGNVSVVQVQEGTLSVKGGTFDLHQKWEGSSKYLFNCIDDAYANGSANVAISGGTFVGFDPSASPEGEGTSYLAPGYAPTDNGDGTYGVKQAVTVTFDSRQGTAVDSQLVAVGDKVAKPANPIKEGYTFSGWFTDEDCTKAYDFDAAVDGTEPEFTLYAGWKAEAQPGTGENGSNGGSGSNGGNSSANANANASTVNNNSHNKGKKPAKGGLPKTGDSLTLVGSVCALVAAIAALTAASVLRRKKMN